MEADGFYNPLQVGSHIYVTLPGGTRQGFTFQPNVTAGLRGAFLGIFEPKFVSDAGVKSSLSVSPADLRIDSNGQVFDYETGEPFNPASPLFGGSYLLTTPDGIAYVIDATTGQLKTISDPNNNTLTFSDAGIVSSTGIGVTFERDPQGRIAAVVDPMGNRIRYQYNANGDLVAVTDRTNNTTQFVYRSTPAHYLSQVIDPLGRTGARTDYDAQGRLTSLIDAAGNPVRVTYDPTHSLETVKDQLGNPTIYEFDDRGNIVTQIDALGGVTRRTFDAIQEGIRFFRALRPDSTFFAHAHRERRSPFDTDCARRTTLFDFRSPTPTRRGQHPQLPSRSSDSDENAPSLVLLCEFILWDGRLASLVMIAGAGMFSSAHTSGRSEPPRSDAVSHSPSVPPHAHSVAVDATTP